MAADDLHARGADTPGFPEGDDLFDFDELIKGAEETVDALTAELDEALAEVEPVPPPPSSAAPPAPVPQPAPVRPAPEISLLGFRERFEPIRQAIPVEDPDDGRAPGRTRLPMGPVLIALAVLGLANLSLVGLTWKSLDTTRELVASAGRPRVSEPSSLPSAASRPRDSIDFPKATLGGPDPEGRAALEAAERSLAAGELLTARRSAYALLAVIDHIPRAEREDVEARASFLVAETYRLQARRADQEVGR